MKRIRKHVAEQYQERPDIKELIEAACRAGEQRAYGCLQIYCKMHHDPFDWLRWHPDKCFDKRINPEGAKVYCAFDQCPAMKDKEGESDAEEKEAGPEE